MKVSLEWLKEFVPIRLPTASLVDRLAMGGLEVISIEKKGKDTLLEIEITPNRPDLLSHIGIAREIAALTGVSMKMPKKNPLTPNRRTSATKLPLQISIQDRSGCSRYMGRLFENVQIGSTPSLIKERLERLGFRSVNPVVDITNYVLLETGQPLHAFDYDRIEGAEVIVRSARRGETLLAIDGARVSLKEEDLVIADARKPVALAGVIGGKETEVGPATQRILLESAFFNPVRVRRTSKRLGIATESSYRFERGVFLEGVQKGSERAHALLESAGASFVSPFLDQGKRVTSTKKIPISIQELNDTLGVATTPPRVKSFLTSLGCRVAGEKVLRVVPPPFRQDLQIPVDLVEEVGRLLGYDKIPATTSPIERTSLEQKSVPDGPERSLEEKVKCLLVSQGLFEAVTYSLLSRVLLQTFFGDETPAIRIQNPISLEQELLRPSLIPRLVETASYNFRRQSEGTPFFELGPVYEREGNRYRERKSLAILLAGKETGTWKTKSTAYDYFDLKGRCEMLCKTFCPSVGIVCQSTSIPFFSGGGLSTELLLKGKRVAILGELSSSIVGQFDLKGRVYVAELNFSEFAKIASLAKRVFPLPKYPSVRRDIALVADRNIPSEELVKTMREQGGEWVFDVSLFDTYSDPRVVPQGSRGLAYRIEFLDPDRTLTDEEVNEKYRSILEALQKKGVQIRSR